MTKVTKENILEMFDEAINKTKAVRDIAKLIDIPRGEVEDILREFDRDVPHDKKADQEPKEEPAEAADQDKPLPIPKFVFDVLTKELDSLDKEISELSDQLALLNQKYTDISKFIKEYK